MLVDPPVASGGQAGKGGQQQQGPAGRSSGRRQDRQQARAEDDLVAGQRRPAVGHPVQPRPEHRAGDHARQGAGGDRGTGEGDAPGAAQHQQDHRDREHLAGQPGQGGRQEERRPARLGPQAPGPGVDVAGGAGHPVRVTHH
jgi:hypothetical protein